MRNFLTGLTVAVLTGLAPATVMGQTSPANQVFQAERDFDAYAAEHGITQGFHAYSAPDAIAFWPQATRIHDLLGEAIARGEGGKDAPSKLRWRPYAVSVATSEDMAWDYGPWTVEGTTEAGWFFTVWQKQADGKWLWTLDSRAGYDDATTFPRPGTHQSLDLNSQPSSAAGIAGVLASEDALNLALKLKKPPVVYGTQLLLATVAGDNGPPSQNSPDKDRHISSRPTGQVWTRDGYGASSTGDMVYIYGHTNAGSGEYTGHYVRVWRKVGPEDKTWVIEFDLYQSARK